MDAEQDLQFGRRAVELRLVSKERLQKCLALQRQWRRQNRYVPLFKILMQAGYIDRRAVDLVRSSLQRRLSPTLARPRIDRKRETIIDDDHHTVFETEKPSSETIPDHCESFLIVEESGDSPNATDRAMVDTGSNTILETDDRAVVDTGGCTILETDDSPVAPSRVKDNEQHEPTAREKRSAVPAGTFRIGGLFHHYQIIEELGRGGMGAVFKAYDTNLKRTVALKVISGIQGTKQIRRFLNEAEATAQIEHPNIVKLYEIGKQPLVYYTMEYIAGQSLSNFVRERTSTPKEIARLFSKVTSALHEIHKNKIIHRDIKPGNIIVSTKGEPKIMDFGIAKRTDAADKLSRTGTVLGSPAYMSPEQADSKELDGRSDVYSLGATMYEALTSRPPFQGESYLNIIAQIHFHDPVPPRELNPDIPVDLETICLKALEKKRLRRYDSARQMQRDLDNFLANRPIFARPPGMATRAKKFFLRNKLLCTTTFVVFTLVTTAVAGYLSLTHQHTQQLRREKDKITQQKATAMRSARRLFQMFNDIFRQYPFLLENPQIVKKLRKRLQELEEDSVWEKLVVAEGDRPILTIKALMAPNPEAAIEIYDQFIRNNPKDAVAYNSRALQYMKQRKWSQAERDFNTAIRLDPKYFYAYTNRGNLYLERGMFAEAERDFTTAIELDPQNFYGYFYRASLYRRQNRLQESIRDFKRAFAIQPFRVEVYSNIGELYLQLKHYRKAQEHTDKAIRMSSQYPLPKTKKSKIYANAGYIYEKQRRFAEAEGLFTKAAQLDPKNPMAYHGRGLTYHKRNLYDKAEKDYDRALELNPDEKQFYVDRGFLYYHQQRYSQAIADWQQALRRNHPERDFVLQYVAKARERLREMRK